jgi:AhpD family alkylhydroperoxidase
MTTTLTTLAPRIADMTTLIPGPIKATQALIKSIDRTAVASSTIDLVHLRVSQINGCSFCLDYGWKAARKEGETDERLFAIGAWREAPYFTDDERAALDLAEAITRIADRSDPVPDAIWDEAARFFDDRGLMAIVLASALTNLLNRVNVSIRQVAGSLG